MSAVVLADRAGSFEYEQEARLAEPRLRRRGFHFERCTCEHTVREHRFGVNRCTVSGCGCMEFR